MKREYLDKKVLFLNVYPIFDPFQICRGPQNRCLFNWWFHRYSPISFRRVVFKFGSRPNQYLSSYRLSNCTPLHCFGEKILSLAKRGRFSFTASLNRPSKLAQYSPLIILAFSSYSMRINSRASEKTVAMNLLAGRPTLIFSSVNSRSDTYCFDSY